MAQSVVEFFNQPQSIDLIQKLEQQGVNMAEETTSIVDNRFENMIFVLTGGLDNYTRDEAEKIIESFGGKTSSSVSKKTTYVLAGEGGGSKLTKAQELGINIISEQDFINMIK